MSFEKHSQDVEILYEVHENDKLAHDLYERIHSNTSRKFVERIWEGDDLDEFFETLSELMQEEEEHIDELEKYARKLDRMR